MPRPEWIIAILSLAATPVTAGELVVATWGGAYERVQQEVLFEPFRAAAGIGIETAAYNGGLAILDETTGDVPDVVDMHMSEAIAACRSGDLRQLALDELPAGTDGTPAGRDFIVDALAPCAITHTVYATVIAYDLRAFPGRKPARIEDFFDLENFPGKRALRRDPAANLEWGLLSYGVPARNLYDLLSTQRGLDLAFRRLDSLRGSLRWWVRGDEPVELLEAGEVAMASGYNGRFFNARNDHDSPIQIIWDGQVQELQTWVIPAAAAQPDAAWQFIRFATETDTLTALAERLAYGPARHSSARQITAHPETGVDMRPHIPTHPYNNRTAVTKDMEWYARVLERIRYRFERWLESAETATQTPE